ncbi:hypothetical protein ABZV34_33635 [Streptomyces sp. NPDC005195]|uniref:hypothetical protein n=1 Tax=Streptomyces sp. NPDC005195 TaxID=3154561 RepID=UPI0033B1B9D9
MKKFMIALCAASASVALAVVPTTAQAAGTQDGAPLVAAENEIIDELATLGWPGQDSDNFYPGAAGHAEADTASVLWGTPGTASSYQVEAKCAQFLTASLKHAYTWATDTWFTSGIGFRSPSSEQYYDAFSDTAADGALEKMSDHINRPSAQRVSDLHAGSVIAVKYLDSSEGGATGHIMTVQSVAPFERDGNRATQEYAVTVADSTSNPHGVALSSKTSPHWAFKDSRVEGSPGLTTKEWSGAGRGTIFIQADATTGKPTGYWWGRNEAAFNTVADRPMVFVDITR